MTCQQLSRPTHERASRLPSAISSMWLQWHLHTADMHDGLNCSEAGTSVRYCSEHVGLMYFLAWLAVFIARIRVVFKCSGSINQRCWLWHCYTLSCNWSCLLNFVHTWEKYNVHHRSISYRFKKAFYTLCRTKNPNFINACLWSVGASTQRKPAHTRRTYKLHAERPELPSGFKSRTFLLWDDGANT